MTGVSGAIFKFPKSALLRAPTGEDPAVFGPVGWLKNRDSWGPPLHCATHNTRHNPHPRAPWVAKGTQHAQQRHEGEGGGFVLRSPKEGLSAGTWRQKVVTRGGGGGI